MTQLLLILIISDDLRKRVWPLLLSLDKENNEPAPQLEELSNHPEYNQVVLDVNRSLKRFPPGIPYDQRVALQDQLTVLILRVITKFPHLSYYQVSFWFIFGLTFITSTNIITTYTITKKNQTIGLPWRSNHFSTGSWWRNGLSYNGNFIHRPLCWMHDEDFWNW